MRMGIQGTEEIEEREELEDRQRLNPLVLGGRVYHHYVPH